MALRRKKAAFLNVANDNPENVMDAYLTYFTGDPAEGRAFIVKYGVNGNHEQMREFVQSRLATKE
jgi:hypothetical protein